MWKGFLKFGQVACGVALHAALSSSDDVRLHTLNRKTGNRVKRQYVDEETGRPVDKDNQVKGYETSKGEHVVLEPEEVASVLPESDKTLHVESFIACDDVDPAFLERPYYLTPTDEVAVDAYSMFREGLRKQSVAAIAHAVLFRRVHTVLVRPYGKGLIASTLHYDYEIRSSKEAFEDVPKRRIEKEMIDLAKHIIQTKRGEYDPRKSEDRYEHALAELVKAKQQGKPIETPRPPEPTKVVDLMEALRKSAGQRRSTAVSRKASKASGRKSGTTAQKRAG
jgi:DNA end-binding protein Ku